LKKLLMKERQEKSELVSSSSRKERSKDRQDREKMIEEKTEQLKKLMK
jgi:hypothetical protein